MGIESQLLHENIRHLDLREYVLVTADTTIRETVERMRDMKRGCAFVIGERTRFVGIFTMRDVLNKVVDNPMIWDDRVDTVMTSSKKALNITASAQDALKMMDVERIRNVPVLQGDKQVIGNVTHFAILDYLVQHVAEAVYNLPPDPDNYANQRDGG